MSKIHHCKGWRNGANGLEDNHWLSQSFERECLVSEAYMLLHKARLAVAGGPVDVICSAMLRPLGGPSHMPDTARQMTWHRGARKPETREGMPPSAKSARICDRP